MVLLKACWADSVIESASSNQNINQSEVLYILATLKADRLKSALLILLTSKTIPVQIQHFY